MKWTGPVWLLLALSVALLSECSIKPGNRASSPSASHADSALAPGAAGGSAGGASEANGGAAEPSGPADVAAAVATLRDYYAAIAAHDYARAWSLWGDGGASSHQSFDEFQRGFAGTASVHADVGDPGPVEGAAGSRYIEIPVEIRARTVAGEDQHFRGHYVLRRVVVDGATAAQRRWHIDSAAIATVH